MERDARKRGDRPHVERRDGVLVVGPVDVQLKASAELASMQVEVGVATSGEECFERLMLEEAPEVVVAWHRLADMSGAELCQRLRAHAAHAGVRTVLLVEGIPDPARDTGRIADELLECAWKPGVLRVAVRNALRAQAHRRIIERRERRRAIGWLGMVVAHEINNPLAAAMTSLGMVRDALEARGAEEEELRQLLGETSTMLERISAATRSFRPAARLPDTPAAAASIGTLLETLRARLLGLGRQVSVMIEPRSLGRAVFQLAPLVEAAHAVAAQAIEFCRGDIDVSVFLDESRVAVVLELREATHDDASIILEPRLVSDEGAPPRFSPGLSALETSFAEVGGQMFARAVDGTWRFGLTLPAQTAPTEDAAVARSA